MWGHGAGGGLLFAPPGYVCRRSLWRHKKRSRRKTHTDVHSVYAKKKRLQQGAGFFSSFITLSGFLVVNLPERAQEERRKKEERVASKFKCFIDREEYFDEEGGAALQDFSFNIH